VSDSLYLGIDVGSGSVKAMLSAPDGAPVGVASSPCATSYPHPGYVEQDPDDWYAAACVAVRKVVEACRANAAQVRGIGLSGTSHVPSMLDDRFRLVRPAIMFNDVRSGAQVARLEREAGDLIRAKTGNSVNCTWSLAQLAWVRENEPDVFSSIRYVLFSKDYLAYRLTGERAADYSSAVSSLLVDAGRLDWDDDLLSLAGLPRAAVPAIHPSTAVVGGLTASAASDMALPVGVPVVVGMLDSAAEMTGVGATDPSVAVIRLGTAGGVMTIRTGPAWREGCMLYPHPVRPLWYYQAGTNAATSSLQWVMRLLGMDATDGAYAEVDRLAGPVPPGADGLLFHPYLLGERAPYWSSRIRGGFSGLAIEHDRPQLLRAVLEGVAYSLRDCTALLDWGAVSDVRLCGGGARSRLWSGIIADVLGLPVNQMREEDASALGAALVARAGCEEKDLGQLSRAAAAASDRIEPDRTRHETYNAGFEQYRQIADQYLETFADGDACGR
jgi:xylulokinase